MSRKYQTIYRRALQDRQPQQFRDLTKSGDLDAHVMQMADQMQEAENLGLSRHRKKHPLPTDYLARVQRLNQDQAMVQEAVLADFLPPEQQT